MKAKGNRTSQSKKFIQRERKLEKIHRRIVVVLIIYFFICYLLEPKTIGHDMRFVVYIVLLPIILGALAIGVYRWRYVVNSFVVNKGVRVKIFLVLFYLLEGFFFSFLGFGTLARMSWDICQHLEAKDNATEILVCNVTSFSSGKRPAVNFAFNGNDENIGISNSFLRMYKNEKASDYQISIRARKGIWNYYSVANWEIIKK